MAQDNAEMATKFSTLNVNAAEFVPSFGFSSAAAVAAAAALNVNNESPAPTSQSLSSSLTAATATAGNTITSSLLSSSAGGGAANFLTGKTTTPSPSATSPTAATNTDSPKATALTLSSVVMGSMGPETLTNDSYSEMAGGCGTMDSVSASDSGTPVTTPNSEGSTATFAAIASQSSTGPTLPQQPEKPPPPPQPADILSSSTEVSSMKSCSLLTSGDNNSANMDKLQANNNNDNDLADSWDVDDEPATTPEDDVADDLEDAEAGSAPKVSKKKLPKVEESRSKKEHVNVVFIGHVDAGKSTIGGQIMSLTGMVDKRTLEKYEREAREKSRESWYLSWALDTNQEERDKGKTVEVGRAFFETERKHFTILDAPGHKSFVPNMIGGAAQADLAVLVISARKGEFETGFDRGGQTREHAMLAKTAGVKHLVVLVNKMDDPTVNWDEVRYNECKDKILPYLKKLGFNPAKDLTFMPCSGLSGAGLRDPIPDTICNWYQGPAFIPFIDELPSLNRKLDGPFIMPIVDKYKDMGTVVMGKVESGCARKGQSLLVMPNRTQVAVDQLWSDDDEVTSVGPGENIKIKLKGIEEEDVSPGFVLCDASNPIRTGKIFDAQVVILEHKSIICAGYSAVMHIHCAAEEDTVKALICLVDKKTGDKSKSRPRFVKQDQVAIMRIECSGMICLEQYKLFQQMGRFTLRDENKTIAIGKVLKVIE